MAQRPLVLVTVGGWIASGKSTVARARADALAAELFVADEIRADYASGGRREAFAPGFSAVVYKDMLENARGALAGGRPVVLDGTFRSRDLRDEARRLARSSGAAFRFVECRAGEAVCRARLREREAAGSPGWLAMFDHFLTLWEAPDEIPADEHEVVDTSGAEPVDTRSA